MGRSRYKIFEQERPHFFTSTIVQWLPLFASPHVVEIIYESWKFMQKEERFVIYGYVIMENHLHFIASSPTNLSKEVGVFRSYTARRTIDLLEEKKAKRILRQLNYYKLKHKKNRKYQFWQEGAHPEAILNDKMMIQKIEYMHYNPVKRGYIDEPVHWRYSSARNYAGAEGLMDITLYEL